LKSLYYKTYSILSIIPLIIIVGSFLILIDLSAFYLSWYDPTYAYLFNGLNLAQGSFELGHTDHPGTPLQLYCAIVIRIVFFIRNETNIVEGVFDNPEVYLYAISYSLVILNVLILFFVGFGVFKVSKNIYTALFIQSTPIVSLISMKYLPVVATESFLILIGLLIVFLSYIYTFHFKTTKKHNYLLFFSILSALSVATKISSFPILIIPFLLLDKYRFRLQYALLTIVFFFLFTLPIVNKFSHHFQFILKIFTHTGIYGSGESGLINSKDFISNLKLIFTGEFPFTFSYIIVFLMSILVLSKHKYSINIDIRKKRLLYGIFIATSLQILIVAKHYNFHYLIPAYNFSILGIFVVWNMLNIRVLKDMQTRNTALKLFVFLSLLSIFTIRLFYSYKFYPNLNNPSNTTVKFLEKHKKTHKILLLDVSNESAFVESALYFGKVYSGKFQLNYEKYLKKKYPVTYFYSQKKGLFDWQNNLMNEKVLVKHSKLLIYAIDKNTVRVKKSINDITKNTKNYISISKIYSNKFTDENIYQLGIDTILINNHISLEKRIYCNMEIVKNKSFTDTTEQFFFKGANLQSIEQAMSGKKSIKLTTSKAFGANTSIYVKHGNFLKIRAWSYSKDNSGVIVASANEVKDFYKSSSSIIFEKGDWKLIELSFYIPAYLKNKKINIYLWNNGNTDIYFDDFIIEEFTYN